MPSEATAILAGRGRVAPIPAANAAAKAERKWLLCRAGEMLCALPIENVVEVMRALAVEQFAGAPKFVRGLSIIRGLPVPVVDLGLIICGEIIRGALLVTIREGVRTIALAVDQVIGITAIEASAFGQMPPLLRDVAAGTIAALASLDGELVILLRSARLVPADVLAQLEAEGSEP